MQHSAAFHLSLHCLPKYQFRGFRKHRVKIASKWAIALGNAELRYSIFIDPISVNPDEMQHSAAFYLGLHCLPKYQFRGFPNS